MLYLSFDFTPNCNFKITGASLLLMPKNILLLKSTFSDSLDNRGIYSSQLQGWKVLCPGNGCFSRSLKYIHLCSRLASDLNCTQLIIVKKQMSHEDMDCTHTWRCPPRGWASHISRSEQEAWWWSSCTRPVEGDCSARSLTNCPGEAPAQSWGSGTPCTPLTWPCKGASGGPGHRPCGWQS